MIRDYRCDRAESMGIPAEAAQGFTFPASYMDARLLAELAQRRKVFSRAEMCILPFCHTLEAEAMGAQIRLDDGSPRAGAPICRTIDELLALPSIDLDAPRLRATLQACQLLHSEGEAVAFAVSGPFTILNSLVDLTVVFRAIRKEPQKFEMLISKLSDEILRFICAVRDSGADLVSYADSAATVGILGPRNMERITRDFTLPLLRKAGKIVGSEQMLVLCPKTALALIDCDCAQWQLHTLPHPMSYGEACLAMRGEVKIGGQCCIQSADTVLMNRVFREILLK